MDSPTILQDRSDMPQSDRKAKAFKKRRQVRNHPKACADNAAGSEDEESRAGGVASAARRGTNTTCSLKCPYYKREPKLHQRTSCKFISYGSMRGVKFHVERVHTKVPACSCCRRGEICHRTKTKLLNINLNRAPFAKVTQAQKWGLLYKELFGEDDVVPSPYGDAGMSMEEENTFISLLTERLVELLGPVAPMAVDQLHGIMVDCKEKARSATTGEDIEFLSPVPASSLPKPLDSHAATINIANQNSVNYPRIPPYLSTSTSTEYYRHSSSEAVVGGCTNPLSSYFDNAVACTHPSIPLKPNPSNFQDSGFLSGATICLDQHKSEFDFNEDPLPPAMWPFSHGLFTPQEPRCTCNNRLHPYQCAYDTAHQDPKIECANAQVSQQFNLDSSPFIPTQDQNVAFSANTFLARNGSNLSMSHDGSLPAKRHMPVAALLGLNDPGDWLEERVPGHFLTRFDPGDGILSQQNVQASTSSGISTEVSRVQDFTFGLEEQQDRANYSQPR